MKKFNAILIIIVFLGLNYGCSTDSDSEVIDLPSNLEFNIQGQGIYKYAAASFNYIEYDGGIIAVLGSQSRNKPDDIWSISVGFPAETGEFDFNDSNNESSVSASIQDGAWCFDPFGGCPPVNRYEAISGILTITKAGRNHVKGTFNFVAAHANGSEKIVHSGWFDITK